MTDYQPVTFADKPPGLENVNEGTHKIEVPKAPGKWPAQPPGLPAINPGTIDEEDPLLGKQNGELQQADAEEVVVCNSYDELYEPTVIGGFDELGFCEELLTGLYVEMSFEKPSKIQGMSLPMICKEPYSSLVAQAQNGCGKTCCFALCILSRIDVAENQSPQAMVMVPTRELAIQNANVIRRMGKYIHATVLSSSETDRLHRQAFELHGDSFITEHVLVGTHGNLRTFRNKGWLCFKRLRVVVLDEADQMIDREGFRDDTIKMMQHVNADAKVGGLQPPQLLLFSATYRNEIKVFADKLFKMNNRDAQKIWVPKEELNLDKIKQVTVQCPGYPGKIDALSLILANATKKTGQTIIFVRFREEVVELRDILIDRGWQVTAISGHMEYHERDRVIEEFRNNVTTILISTDVLSRGFDSSNVTLVINFDLPLTRNREPAFETYLHRVGRTGRFKRKGAAFNFINEWKSEGGWYIKQIEDYFDKEIPVLDVTDEQTLVEFMKQVDLGEDIE